MKPQQMEPPGRDEHAELLDEVQRMALEGEQRRDHRAQTAQQG
jgi:hypothetical protein